MESKTNINPNNNLQLISLVDDWMKQERMGAFFLQYPRLNDTVMKGLEGWIKYSHGVDGYGIIATVYEKSVYIEYEEASVEASDPDFFVKLKAALSRHEATHASCKHIRNLDD